MKYIRVKNLSFSYNQTPVLRALDLEIEQGTLCGVVGPNGAGKSTLLKLMAGLLKPSTGCITIGEVEISHRSARAYSDVVATVPQESKPAFGFTVSEMVMMARFIRQNRLLFEKKEDWSAVEEALQEMDISHLSSRPITHLSGGERQRVYLARALAQETPVLLLDEPASHLDIKHQVHIYELLKHLQKDKGKTIVMVTHDLNLASQYCDTIALLGKDGQVIHGITKEILKKETILNIFDIECHVICKGEMNFFFPYGQRIEKS